MNRPAEARGIDRIDEAHRDRVDEALRSWRQGDCVLGDQAFLFRLNPAAPISAATAMTRRMSRKHDARSDEGRALRALREIRVRATPSWRADEVDLLFLFVRDDTAQTFAGQTWDSYLDQWLRRVRPNGRFTRVDGVVQTLADLTAREYVESDPLDLDHLSAGERVSEKTSSQDMKTTPEALA